MSTSKAFRAGLSAGLNNVLYLEPRGELDDGLYDGLDYGLYVRLYGGLYVGLYDGLYDGLSVVLKDALQTKPENQA